MILHHFYYLILKIQFVESFVLFLKRTLYPLIINYGTPLGRQGYNNTRDQSSHTQFSIYFPNRSIPNQNNPTN